MENIHEILKKYWGYDTFRPLQEEIIHSVLNGNDTLALLPTGGGKSLCFQVPALAMPGICIVVSPLIALMKDQVENLVKRGIKAVSIVSGMHNREIEYILDNCEYGKIRFLYVSPERLQSDMLRERIRRMKVSFIAVDEAHCISQWGYDFRPPYLKIAELRELIPHVPILALTATATKEVSTDIQQKLHFKKENVFRKSFERDNLSYSVLHEENKLKRLLSMLHRVQGTAVVYVRNRKKTKAISDFLLKNKISSDYYHAGLDIVSRAQKQDAWIKGTIRVIVATNAFGMGIDKPDVRLVVHMDLPDNLEAYYQEAGRAGRDEKKAHAVLLYDQTDIKELKDRIETNFPAADDIKKIYNTLGNYFQLAVDSGEGCSFDFDLTSFCEQYNFSALKVFSAFQILEMEGYLARTDAFLNPSKLKINVSNQALYQFQLQNENSDLIIKTILRSYEGLFDDFVKINENDIAKRIKLKFEDIFNSLQYLDKTGLVTYYPQKNKPQIFYPMPRIRIENVSISKEILDIRKKKFEKRIQSVIKYITDRTLCRSTMLLEYFDEKPMKQCGQCDVCRNQNIDSQSDRDVQEIAKKIELILKNGSLNMDMLMSNFKDTGEEKVLNTIRWMIDNSLVLYTSENELSLT